MFTWSSFSTWRDENLSWGNCNFVRTLTDGLLFCGGQSRFCSYNRTKARPTLTFRKAVARTSQVQAIENVIDREVMLVKCPLSGAIAGHWPRK